MQNIGRNHSKTARKSIEQILGLVKATDKKQSLVYDLKPVNTQKIQYGKTETKRAIINVLDVVFNSYKYTSMPELNAIFQQYNVITDRGNESSRIFRDNGLVYRVLDSEGNRVRVPVKASNFLTNLL